MLGIVVIGTSGYDPIHRARAHRHKIGIEHHEGHSTASIRCVFVVEIDNGLLFPVLDPRVARNPGIMNSF
jgi:hypothetical protein